MYLAFGASRGEACRPLAREGLRLALTPTINQMRCVQAPPIISSHVHSSNPRSVIGLIAIPGMMTGALLGGASVNQAAKLQMIIMFMISASTTLASIVTTTMALGVVVDGEHRVRSDRIDVRQHAIWRARDRVLANTLLHLQKSFGKVKKLVVGSRRRADSDSDGVTGNGRDGERTRLLG
jgi:hypothetical protein